jgi:hypothetical protein
VVAKGNQTGPSRKLGQDKMSRLEAHRFRAHTLFEGSRRPARPELTDAQRALAKKREEVGNYYQPWQEKAPKRPAQPVFAYPK